MITIDHAYKLREMIEKSSVSLDDADALEAIELYPIWAENTDYAVEDRVRYNNMLYKCLQAHTSQESWNPVDAVSLWAKVLIPDPEDIPVWEQPESTNPYMAGDKVYYPTADDDIWVSTIDNNVWEPGVYGWEKYVE